MGGRGATLVVWLCLGCALGCTDEETRAQVIVIVEAEDGVRARAETLRLEVEGREGRDDDMGVERLMQPAFEPDWPVRLALAPQEDDATRLYLVTAEALDADDNPIATARLLSGFVPGEVRYVQLVLEDACLDKKACGEEQTCSAGQCADAFLDAKLFAQAAGDAPTTAMLLQDAVTTDDGGAPIADAGSGPPPSSLERARLAAGDSHVCAIDAAGALFCWGENARGQLGDGSSEPKPTPIRVGAESDWTSISAGQDHTCGIRFDASLWCWGDNSDGQVGVGSTDDIREPREVASDEGWSAVDAGHDHTCGIRTDGSLWCWGEGVHGALGLGSDRATADEVHADELAPVRVGTDMDWVQVSGARTHTCGVRSDGTRWCWGRNDLGQLGDDTTEDRDGPVRADTETDWVHVDAGDEFTCGVRADESLWCWGLGDSHRLGNGAIDVRTMPTRVFASESARWVSVTLGDDYACARQADATLWCWGKNGTGQLGLGHARNQHTPARHEADDWEEVVAGMDHTCGRKGDASLWCWGDNDRGELAQGTLGRETAPQRVGGNDDWSELSAGSDHACAIRAGGELHCWGDNAYGQLGDGTNEQRGEVGRVGTVSDWRELGAGGNHTCATRSDGSLWCWGFNGDGQIGDGTTEHRPLPLQVTNRTGWRSPGLGDSQTCLIDGDGALWCWGRDLQDVPAQIGSDTDWTSVNSSTSTGRRFAGVRAAAGLWRGPADPLEQIGSALDWEAVDYGNEHLCGLRSGGTVWCWGENGRGQLGDGTRDARVDEAVQVGGWTDWTRVSAGLLHSCGIRASGTLWCWGNNGAGAVGDGTTTTRELPVQVGSESDWTRVSAAYEFTCGIRSPGSLWCWGTNTNGQLGDGKGGVTRPVAVELP